MVIWTRLSKPKCVCYTNVMRPIWLIIIAAVIVVAGVGTGYLLSSRKSMVAGRSASQDVVTTDKEIGVKDTATFSDSAQGRIQKGGLNGEGTHQLVRDGGPSQTVYLVSSIVDLDQFVDKKVEVWGQTVKAAKAAWLMDVGRVRILE